MEAIGSAVWAPNHHRTEPWHFYLLGDSVVEKLCQLNADLVRANKGEKAAAVKLKRWRSVPGWIVLTCNRSDDEIRQQEDYAACCCAAQNFSLHLWALGIGVKWTTGAVTREDQFFEFLNIDKQSELVVGLFWYGLPAAIPDQHRKSTEDITTVIP